MRHTIERKAADVIGLYVNPPQHAAVFCVDEKTAIQALDRLDPALPLSPGRLERHGFEYDRQGTLSLYAALDTKSGEVLGKTVARHTSEEFVAFLTSIIASQRLFTAPDAEAGEHHGRRSERDPAGTLVYATSLDSGPTFSVTPSRSKPAWRSSAPRREGRGAGSSGRRRPSASPAWPGSSDTRSRNRSGSKTADANLAARIGTSLVQTAHTSC